MKKKQSLTYTRLWWTSFAFETTSTILVFICVLTCVQRYWADQHRTELLCIKKSVNDSSSFFKWNIDAVITKKTHKFSLYSHMERMEKYDKTKFFMIYIIMNWKSIHKWILNYVRCFHHLFDIEKLLVVLDFIKC